MTFIWNQEELHVYQWIICTESPGPWNAERRVFSSIKKASQMIRFSRWDQEEIGHQPHQATRYRFNKSTTFFNMFMGHRHWWQGCHCLSPKCRDLMQTLNHPTTSTDAARFLFLQFSCASANYYGFLAILEMSAFSALSGILNSHHIGGSGVLLARFPLLISPLLILAFKFQI